MATRQLANGKALNLEENNALAAKTLAAHLLNGLHWVGVTSEDGTITSPTIVPRICYSRIFYRIFFIL